MFEYYIIWLLGLGALLCDKKFIHIPIFIILTLFCGFRYNIIGYDYSVYQEYYNALNPTSSYTEQLYKYEYGFFLLAKFCSSLNFSFINFMLIIACFYHYALYKFSRSFKYCGLFIFVFISFFYMWQAYVITRQSIAMAIIFLYFSYYPLHLKTPRLISKQNLYFIFSVIVASLFHLSALIFLIIQGLHYLQVKFLSKKNIFILIILIILSVILFTYFAIFDDIKARLNYYLDNDEQTQASIMNVIECLGLMLAYLLVTNKKCFKQKTLILYAILGLFFSSLSYAISDIFIRISEYFKFALVILYCEIYVHLTTHKALYLLTLIILGGLRYLRFFENFNPQSLVKYEYIIPF